MTMRPIMIVEDNPMDLDLTQRAFKKHEILNPVIIARDGVEAVERLDTLKAGMDLPVMVLLDLKLPKKDGFEVLTKIKTNSFLSSIPVIVLTSSTDSGDIKRAYHAGANSYLIKPVDFSMFIDLVKQIYEYWSNLNILPG